MFYQLKWIVPAVQINNIVAYVSAYSTQVWLVAVNIQEYLQQTPNSL